MLTVAYWAVWHNRNKLQHEGLRESVGQVVGFIRGYMAEANFLNRKVGNKPLPLEASWEPPKSHQFKINSDASLEQTQARAIARVVIRNKEGSVMGACAYLF